MHTLRTARDVASRLFVAVVAATTPLAAQTATQISFFGGIATDQLGQRSNAVGIAPSLTFAPSANVSAHLGGTAVRFATDAWSLGASASLSGRDAITSHLAFTLRAGASASRLQGAGTGTYREGDFVPALELTASRLTVFAGGRVVGGSATQDAVVPGAGLFEPVHRGTSRSRAGGGPYYGAALTLLDEGDRSMTISAHGEHVRIAGITSADHTIAASLVNGAVRFTATAGLRHAPDERDAWANGMLSIPFVGAASLEIGGGRYAGDRVLGTPAGEFLSAGLSIDFGRRASALPSATGVPAPSRGITRLAIRAPEARTIELAGDFTNWKTVPAQRAPNGVWYADLRIAPGRYRYAFRVNGADWRVPDGATAVDDGFGGKSAWIEVR